MKYWIWSFLMGLVVASPKSYAANDLKHKAFFEKLAKAYKQGSPQPIKLSEFKKSEQVWLGECASHYDFSGPYYTREESYLPVIRHKTAPGETLKIQFSSVGVGSNPYSSKHIDSPKDAIWFLRGDAGNRISLAAFSKELNGLLADYYDKDLIGLKRGTLGSETVYLYAHWESKKRLTTVCYFNEKVL